MSPEIVKFLEKAISSKYKKEALHHLRVAVKALENEIFVEDENRAFMERTAGQPFEGANPCLRNYPFSKIG
ncbi:MAG: hypothetical protein Q8Q17_02945 [bacterium]|nr:hypothetical protein [bacterium]